MLERGGLVGGEGTGPKFSSARGGSTSRRGENSLGLEEKPTLLRKESSSQKGGGWDGLVSRGRELTNVGKGRGSALSRKEAFWLLPSGENVCAYGKKRGGKGTLPNH